MARSNKNLSKLGVVYGVLMLFPLSGMVVGFFGWGALPYVVVPAVSLLALGFYLNEKGSGAIAGAIYGTGKTYTDYVHRGLPADMSQAQKLSRDQDWTKAAELYETIVEKAPGEVEPLFQLAQTYENMNKSVQSQLAYKRVNDRFGEELGEDHMYIREAKTKIATLVDG